MKFTIKDQNNISSLNKVSDLMKEATDSYSLADALIQIVNLFVDVQYCGVFFWEPHEQKLKMYASRGFTKQEQKESERTAMDRHPGWVFKNQEPLLIQDMDLEETPTFAKSSKRSFIVKSRLWLPISSKNRPLGAYGFASTESNYFTEDHIATLSFVCQLAGNSYADLIRSRAETEYHKQLMLSYERAKLANHNQQHFLSRMSHEIRTPMNGIIGLSEILAESILNDYQKNLISVINNQSKVLLNLINDILDISKVHVEGINLVSFSFKLKKTIKECIDMQSPEAQGKNLTITLEYDDSINKYLIGDALRVHQIITNLLSNAIKFTEKGGVTIQVKRIDDNQKQQIIQIDVIDTGIGMDEKNIPKIFQSYEQENDQIDQKYGGTGLGLAIVSEIIQKMNGTIDVKSQKDIGSTFSIRIPFLTESKRSYIGKKPTVNKVILKNIRVLIVEDNAINMMYTQSILTKQECIIDKAINGQEAIDKCKGNQYDIILMDLQMPEIDGISATEIIRNELNLDTPIIAQTANTIQKDVNRCFEVGMNDYIPKPYSSQDLIEKMANFVEIDLSMTESKEKYTPNSIETSKSLDIYAKTLKLVDNDMDEAFDMLETIQEEIPKYLLELQSSFNAEQIDQIKKSGHKLKSTFRLFRINRAFTLCLNFEMYTKENGDLSELGPSLDELTAIVHQLLDEIKIILG